MKKLIIGAIAVLLLLGITGCMSEGAGSSDQVQREQQEQILKDATAQTGMPAIKNFRERKILKDIFELRDQDGLTTYTYVFNELDGKLVFLGETIGYGIPYATQYTNPEKVVERGADGVSSIPQADPNGLFSPESAEGTWVLMAGPDGQVHPLYVEPRIIVSPFKLSTD